jgi:hypothetical protein
MAKSHGTSLFFLIVFIFTIDAFARFSSGASQPFRDDPSGFEKVDEDLAFYDSAVESMTTEFSEYPSNPKNIEWVKNKLQHMVDIDQFTRNFLGTPTEKAYAVSEREYFSSEFGTRLSAVDRKNTDDLKQLLKIYQWFKISQFGAVADRNAWLLIQHADQQPDFQNEVLKILEPLYKIGETDPRNYAYLFDRVAASFSDPSKRSLQRYGTQGNCVGPGVWEAIPIEDPAKVDQRRAKVGLGRMTDYVARFKDICR